MFQGFDFLSGEVTWQDNCQQEDMLQVKYPNNYILDVSWVEGTGQYIIRIIRDFEWRVPVAEYVANTEDGMKAFLNTAIQRIEKESHIKPYYGALWKTDEYHDEDAEVSN
ncbi:MAG: hypothetical protein IJA20_07350 [Methanocorpusculum sp.]|nr:hypothetical protein [Oscillospiraceae bacterium]MBQ3570472.1 hypothetical protein [Methanocorpusculum sp.]